MVKKKKIAPDYKCSSLSMGSTKDLDEKAEKIYDTVRYSWPRWFDNKKLKRKVYIRVEKFYGDYHHWYAKIEEEDNPYWFPPKEDEYHKEGTWVKDTVSRGQNFSERFNTEDGARSYVNLILKDHFPNHDWIEGDVVYGDGKKWNYSKEGD